MFGGCFNVRNRLWVFFLKLEIKAAAKKPRHKPAPPNPMPVPVPLIPQSALNPTPNKPPATKLRIVSRYNTAAFFKIIREYKLTAIFGIYTHIDDGPRLIDLFEASQQLL
jgi:hypothetical protein